MKGLVKNTGQRKNHVFRMVLSCIASLLPACSPNQDEALYIQGTTLFLLFLAVVTLTIAAPLLNRWKAVARLVEKLKKEANLYGHLTVTVGLLLSLMGTITFPSGDWSSKLLLLAGCMIVVLGQAMILWSKANDPVKSATYFKVMLLTTSFLGGMVYLMIHGRIF